MNRVNDLSWLKNLNPFSKQKKIPITSKAEIESIEPQKRMTFKRDNKNFGTQHNLDDIIYKTLKVIPRSKRIKENCNSCGVQND